ncbi:hypothetical protein V2J09_003960 [Rumex salicifolius]
MNNLQVNRENGTGSPSLMGEGINLQFAFNDRNFSDRLLHVEIIADSLPSASHVKPERELTNGDAIQVKTVHLNSAILAACSPFFYKLFTNGMRETMERDVALRINASEEKAFMDRLNSQEKVKELSLFDLKAMLGVDGLKVESEDQIFDLIVKWGRACFPNVKERQAILTTHLAWFIYFSFMIPHKLEHLLVSDDFIQLFTSVPDTRTANKSFSRQPLAMQLQYDDLTSTTLLRLCILNLSVLGVNLYLRRDEVESLYPCERRHLQSFLLRGRWFSLKVACDLEHQEFGLYLRMLKGSKTCTLDYEFAVMKTTTSSKEFQSAFKKTNSSFNPGAYWGKLKLFGVLWFDFIGDRSQYFSNGVLHL